MSNHDCPTAPARSPEISLVLHVDGSLAAVELISRLHAGGLQLRQGSDDDYAVITLAEPRRGISARLFTPKTTPAAHIPRNGIELLIDGEIDGVDLTRRLDSVGLEMRNMSDDVAGARPRWVLIDTADMVRDENVHTHAKAPHSEAAVMLGERLDDVACFLGNARAIIEGATDILDDVGPDDANRIVRANQYLYGSLKLLEQAYQLCAARREVPDVAR
jgi:hypothetical protein